AFSGNTVKRVSLKAKGYIADTGTACAALAISSPVALGGHPSWGALFESAVVSDIRKQAAALGAKPNFYHWRSHGGGEVDLILERDGMYFPIEIKASSQPTKAALRGINAFRNTYPDL